MRWPAAESAQQGSTRRCAISGDLCDTAGGKEARQVLGALAAVASDTHRQKVTVDCESCRISIPNVVSFENINRS